MVLCCPADHDHANPFLAIQIYHSILMFILPENAQIIRILPMYVDSSIVQTTQLEFHFHSKKMFLHTRFLNRKQRIYS